MAEPWEVVARLRPKFAERAADTDRTGDFPVADFADLRDAGLFGLFAPKRLGGLGLGYVDYARVAFEMARGNGATALVFNMHASITGALAGIPSDASLAPANPVHPVLLLDEARRLASQALT